MNRLRLIFKIQISLSKIPFNILQSSHFKKSPSSPINTNLTLPIYNKKFFKLFQQQRHQHNFQMSATEIVDQVFAQFDADKSGTLDKNELKTVLDFALQGTGQTVSEQDIEAAIKGLDTDNDGTISKAEFGELIKLLLSLKSD